MKILITKTGLGLLFFCFFLTSLSAQDHQGIWSKVSKKEDRSAKKLKRKSEPEKALYYKLDIDKLKSTLNANSKSKFKNKSTNLILKFPNSAGGFDQYEVQESSIMEPGYQAKHPELRTYLGKNVKNPSSTISFSITPQGLNAMVLGSKMGAQFIDPYNKESTYMVYSKRDLPAAKEKFKCLVEEDTVLKKNKNKTSNTFINPQDSRLRIYRLALSTTVEYSRFHWKRLAELPEGADEEDKKAVVRSAIIKTMTRVNAIFQRDLAIKMVLVDNNDELIFINDDALSNSRPKTLIVQNQNIVDQVIGTENYDIGHVFSIGTGGVARRVGVLCNELFKAQGVTGSNFLVGDAFDVNYVAHEFGHQFGANHTFSSCESLGGKLSYEPGSGSTIMGYAGICESTPQDHVQLNSDPYFHQATIQEIWNNITNVQVCGAQIPVSNKPPVANAGSDYTIPISTPFKLVGASTDPDGTKGHTYTWEQYDLGRPLFRSYEGSRKRTRTIPEFQDYIATGGSTQWEKLPTVNRNITFALTVRDNDIMGENGAGQTDVDFKTITVNSITPFTVNTPTSWEHGEQVKIRWEVGQTANTGSGAINCQRVRIKLSTNGGKTFPITIANKTKNDGIFNYIVPNSITQTNKVRILIEAVDNIFYAVSSNFLISAKKGFIIDDLTLKEPVTCGTTEVKYTFNYEPKGGFSDTTIFRAKGIPKDAKVRFNPKSAITGGKVTMTISNLKGVLQDNQGDYEIEVTAMSNELSYFETINLALYNSHCTPVRFKQSLVGTDRVRFNTINKKSRTDEGYSNFTAFSTDIKRGDTHNLIINVNTDTNPDESDSAVHTIVWIDWNQNCSFEDPGEEFNLGKTIGGDNSTRTTNSPFAITVPDNAVLGRTTMRVSTKSVPLFSISASSFTPKSCDDNFSGEVEDYTINIQKGSTLRTLALAKLETKNIIIQPNPNNGTFNISATNFNGKRISASVYEVSGRLIFKSDYEVSNDFKETIQLQDAKSGLYLLVLNNGVEKVVKKIVVK